jgi:hypothetical protein
MSTYQINRPTVGKKADEIMGRGCWSSSREATRGLPSWGG